MVYGYEANRGRDMEQRTETGTVLGASGQRIFAGWKMDDEI